MHFLNIFMKHSLFMANIFFPLGFLSICKGEVTESTFLCVLKASPFTRDRLEIEAIARHPRSDKQM